MFDDMLNQNKSIMTAYSSMTVKESDDSGGDTSAYNKYLLATTGDLPKTKKEYMDDPEKD